MAADEDYNSPDYRRWRYKILVMHDFTCCITGQRSGGGVEVQVHHIKPVSKYPHLKYALGNGVVLEKNFHLNVVTGNEEMWEKKFEDIAKKKLREKGFMPKRAKNQKPKYNAKNPRMRF